MEMNPLKVFFKPRSSIAHAVESPNLGLAILLVVLPAIVSVIGTFLFGFTVDALVFVLAVFSQLLLWMLVTIVFYLLIYAFKGQEVRQKISGLASAVALTKMASIGLIVVGMLFPLMLSPSIWDNIKSFQAGNIDGKEFVSSVSLVLEEEEGALNLFGMEVLLVIAGILVILYLYWHYLIVSHITGFGIAKSFFIWLVLMIAVFFVSAPFPGLVA